MKEGGVVTVLLDGLIIVAGGSARRFGSNKLLKLLAGLPLFIHSMKNLGGGFSPERRVVVVPATEMDIFKHLAQKYLPEMPFLWVAGGAERYNSVQAGLKALPEDTDCVAIHDAARPLATQALLDQVMQKAREIGGAIPGRAVTNSLKRANNSLEICETISREQLFAVETPQCFKYSTLLLGYYDIDVTTFTDDAAVMEAMDKQVAIVPNEAENMKLTYPNELDYLDWLLRRGR